MSKGFVGLCHAMSIFLLLNGATAIIRGIQKLGCQLFPHCLFTTRPGVGDNPSYCQRSPAILRHFHGNLVSSAPHSPGLDLQDRLNIIQGFLEDFYRVVLGTIFNQVEAAVKSLLRNAFLALDFS